MNFVNEQYIVFFEVGEEPGEITRFVQNRSWSYAKTNAQFLWHDVRQGGFTQAGRSMQQDVVKGLTALLGRSNEDLQIF